MTLTDCWPERVTNFGSQSGWTERTDDDGALLSPNSRGSLLIPKSVQTLDENLMSSGRPSFEPVGTEAKLLPS